MVVLVHSVSPKTIVSHVIVSGIRFARGVDDGKRWRVSVVTSGVLYHNLIADLSQLYEYISVTMYRRALWLVLQGESSRCLLCALEATSSAILVGKKL